MAVGKADDCEGENRKDDLYGKEDTTADLQPGAIGDGGTANAA